MRWDSKYKRMSRNTPSGPSYKNPLHGKNSWQQYIIDRLSFFGLLILLIIIIFFYLIFYSPLLRISKIEISGNENISAEIIDQKYVRWQLQQQKWIIFKQNNILLFSKSWLRDNIQDQYMLESIEINKNFPHTLIIVLTEKNPSMIWSTNNKLYYLDANGYISSEITEAEELPDLLKIIDGSDNEVKSGKEILNTEKIAFINDLNDELNNISSIKIISFTLPHLLGKKINIQTEAGYQIFFDSSSDLTQQISNLKRVLNESEAAQDPQEYIDLTYGEKVYIK